MIVEDTTSDISDLNTLLLADRRVFANFSRLPKEPFEAIIGSARALLEPADTETLKAFTLPSQYSLQTLDLQSRTRSLPPEGAPGEIYKLWVNELKDWVLSGSQTLQLNFTRREAPCRVEIERPIIVEANRPGLLFQTYLATHRAEATLIVKFRHVESDESETHKVAFKSGYSGGQLTENYQQVALPLPNWTGRIEIRIAVAYQRYVDDGSDDAPFVFLADNHVTKRRTHGTATLTPNVAIGPSVPGDGVWLSALLPALPAPGSTIKLRCGQRSANLTLGEAPDIQVDHQYGHTLFIDSKSEALLSLYVDGKPDRQIAIQPGSNPVRVPNVHLDGSTHLLSLRDKSGTVTYWERFILVPAILTPADIMQRESAAPFPASIFAQTPRRYASLRALFAKAGPGMDFAQLSHALETVEAGYEKVRLKPLRFPQIENPDVSIVIPAHNKVEVTYRALCSLLVAPNEASFEVIVVDDASTDETAKLEEIVSGITVLHNSEPQRFIRACNAGAELARGDYIVLLNNDVEVTVGWLDELIACFGRFDRVGLAGSKLLHPDGRLQDGGGIIWGSGNPWNYGNRQNPDEPRFCYARQADYLSGAAMMVPKSVWKQVGGLSSYLEPMYFEDTDFAFKVRDAGYTTWFVPSSIVYHYEGMTSGTDVTKGFKRYQEVNRPKFKRRWVNAYAQHGREAQKPDLEKDRGIAGRVLFIDYTTPRPDQDAGSYAAIQEIRLVQSLGYKVTFVATNMAHLGKYTEDLQKLGVEMIYSPFYMTMQDFLNQRAAEFDAFYITRYYVALEVLSQIRALAPDAKVLFNNADLHFLREIRAASANGDQKRLEDARQTREQEMSVIAQVDVVLSYNESEHAVIEAYSEGKAKVLRAPWVVEMPAQEPQLAGRSGLSFLGSFRHHPNAEGVLWFVHEVMPRLTASQPDLVLSVYGSRMTDEIKALESDSVDPAGFVQDVADAYDPHRVFVAPLLSGAGIKGKVLEALARGIPCVLSPVAAEGVGLRHGEDCFIARTPEEWIEAITRLNQDDALWQAMSETARRYMAENYSFARGRIAMRAAFEAADMFLPERHS
ncbi:glycosyltransferase [Antarcticimicrobium luteum]|uniref:Glycosyltransferase n=1 Tax=Antarcticimicrobium luteum TaxID=2547397 RepID=A0A4R5VDI3_9RHOB|nr:glycosyltransferase [Antarcticimicrobium luteum]TDK50406.1 glycosyltransferase [Antarcticimicrobium luteum]